MSLGDIRANRHGSTPHLTRDAESLVSRECLRAGIHRNNQVDGLAPHLQIPIAIGDDAFRGVHTCLITDTKLSG
jgi:hypothetical protein